MAVFISSFLSRVPSGREELKEFIIQDAKYQHDMVFSDKQLFADCCGPGLRRKNPDISEKSIESFRTLINAVVDHYDVTINNNFLIAMAAMPPDEIIRILMRTNWIYFVAGKPSCFITSDCPCSMHDGLGSGASLQFPLTSEIMFVAPTCKDDGTKKDIFIDIPKEYVGFFNTRTLRNADKLVVSCKPDFFTGQQNIGDEKNSS